MPQKKRSYTKKKTNPKLPEITKDTDNNDNQSLIVIEDSDTEEPVEMVASCSGVMSFNLMQALKEEEAANQENVINISSDEDDGIDEVDLTVDPKTLDKIVMLDDKYDVAKKHKIFPNYCQDCLDKIRDFLSTRTNVLRWPFSKEPLTAEHLTSLCLPDQLLDGYIINNYLSLISKTFDNKIANVNSLFSVRQTSAGQSWLATEDMFSKEKLLFPIHCNLNHWALVCADLARESLTVYDSFPQIIVTTEDLALVLQFLFNEFKREGIICNMVGWKVFDGVCVKQSNVYDCGVFVCINSLLIAQERPLVFRNSDIPLYRQRMTYELISGKLLG